jgi:hypothetical protein
MFAPEAVIGFQKLGLTETAQIVREATSLFGDDFPRVREKRWDFLDSFSGEKREEYDPFFQLDDKFYASFEIEGVSSMVNDKFLTAAIDYAKKN